jgi:hypothetical protein
MNACVCARKGRSVGNVEGQPRMGVCMRRWMDGRMDG